MRTLLTLSLVLTAFCSHAAPRFNGSTGYQFQAGMATVTLTAGMIDNSASQTATGTLQFQLWAGSKPYAGGTISGRLLASSKLDPLKAGQLYRDVRKVVAYTPPPVKGTYHLTLVLTEYRKSGYVIVDHRNITKTLALGPLETLSLTGPFQWQTSYANGTVSLGVAKISHRRTGSTGSLKVALWATTTPFRGGRINGYQICSLSKKALAPGYNYPNLKATVPFTPPPDGTYFITMMLTEFQKDGVHHMMDYLTTPEAFTFKKP
jgi:hypothetical protein